MIRQIVDCRKSQPPITAFIENGVAFFDDANLNRLKAKYL